MSNVYQVNIHGVRCIGSGIIKILLKKLKPIPVKKKVKEDQMVIEI